MKSDQLKIFQDITLAYFSKIVPQEKPPVMLEPYLRFDTSLLLDFTSVVFISGSWSGCIYLTTSTSVLDALLAQHGEKEFNDRTRFDMCRELSNVLSGNASRAFGAAWTISVPQSLTAEEAKGLKLPGSAFIMPFVWKDLESFLVVGLKPQKRD